MNAPHKYHMRKCICKNCGVAYNGHGNQLYCCECKIIVRKINALARYPALYARAKDRMKAARQKWYRAHPEFLQKQNEMRRAKNLVKFPEGKRKEAHKLGFRSYFEVQLNEQLKKARCKFSYESEKLPYKLDLEYVPDFVLISKAGKTIYIEAKGLFDPGARRKMVAVKKQHPELDIRLVFYDAHAKMRKGSETTNADWAKKNGFPFADKVVPRKWMEE